MMMQDNKTVALIGGGAACVATFIALVKRRAAKTLYVVAPGQIGPGMVFLTSDDALLCNTSAELMSVMTDDPADFIRYQRDRGSVVSAEDFVPRSWVGAYLADRFHEYVKIARERGITVVHLPLRFLSAQTIDPCGYRLSLTDGHATQTLDVTDAIFCTGLGAPRLPEALKPYRDHALLIRSPYPERSMLERVAAGSRVLVIGSKLSAVDAAILLCRQGCRVTMVSPSGSLPAVRSRSIRIGAFRLDRESLDSILRRWTPGNDGASFPKGLRHAYLKYVARHLSAFVGKSWRNQFAALGVPDQRLREQIRLAESGQNQWQDLLVDLVDAVNEVYARSERPFPGGIHPAIMHSIEPYLTSLALPNARKLLHFMDIGLLSVATGQLKEVISPGNTSASWCVDWGDGQKNFGAVVVAAGFHLPRVVANGPGRAELDHYSERAQHAVGVTHSLTAAPARPAGQGNLWFVGPPAHARVPIASALFVTASVAERVAARLHGEHRTSELEACHA
ncbi:FAD/NAD(P)-binding protein [Paraburkholderia humisilvae]|uniref:FAD-dependent urate hydroxylase HpyO/Asp monooxygenase CreE-like FAD/NAD(P)-binding domain-containing protein n=1 Tax=Paraburkholderia humisilvae TaxID=627669 RepID=A0A6J5EH72_9BURK|nr:FAD/NAD(P)-binding protein [Paraburkholderia humisilvae]CAB3764395.1 hypothetical protein LMG29542_04884 [Paraburkholderia humisilvae]